MTSNDTEGLVPFLITITSLLPTTVISNTTDGSYVIFGMSRGGFFALPFAACT